MVPPPPPPRAPRVLAAAALLPVLAAGLDKVRIDPETGLFRDGHGRVRIFHGMNVVFKQAPWYPTSDKFDPANSLDGKTMDLLRKWGFNVVRLGVMWPGVEPAEGQIDSGYLDEISRLSEELSHRDVYTLVDLHQDVGSRRFCGEGIPEYYIDKMLEDPNSTVSRAPEWPAPLGFKFPPANETGGIPPMDDCLQHSFAQYYLTDRVGAMWRKLYTAGTDLHRGFLRYWIAVSTKLTGKAQVLGYELLNEPSGFCLGEGTWSCADAVHALGNSVEGKFLMPLYQAAAQVIRAVDAATPIFYEATVVPKVSDVFPYKALGDGEDQQGLAYHIYCPPGDGGSAAAGFICERSQDAYTGLYHGFLRKHRGVGGFMTEFGAIGGSAAELRHLSRLLGMADRMFQSWTYWMLKMYHDFTTANAEQALWDADGKVETAKLATLSRTYAPAIGGTPTEMHFDPATGFFSLTFSATVDSAPTVVYLNEELNYPHGFDAQVEPAGCLEMSQKEPNYLGFDLKSMNGCKGARVTIHISRKRTDLPPSSETPVVV